MEERRVGKECRSRWSPNHEKNKQNRHEWHARCPRRQPIVNVVSHVKRRSRIASAQYLQQPVRMRLLPRHVVHRHHATKVPRPRPAFKCISKFPPRPPRKQAQFESLRPPLHLLWRNQHLFPPHIPRPTVEIPVKLLKRVARLLVRRWPAQRRRPVRDHAPVVVISRLALPFIEFRPGHSFPGKKSYCLESRTPKTLAHVHQDAVHIKNQNLRNWVKSFTSAQCRQISSMRFLLLCRSRCDLLDHQRMRPTAVIQLTFRTNAPAREFQQPRVLPGSRSRLRDRPIN